MPSLERSRTICLGSDAGEPAGAVGADQELFAIENDPAAVRNFQKVEAAKEGALARAGTADDRDDLAGRRGQRHTPQDRDVAEALVNVLGDQCRAGCRCGNVLASIHPLKGGRAVKVRFRRAGKRTMRAAVRERPGEEFSGTAIRKVRGNAKPTKTPMGYCDVTSPREPTCRYIPKLI